MAFACPHCSGEIDQGTINERMRELTTKAKAAADAQAAAEALATRHAGLAEAAQTALTAGLAAKDTEYESVIAFTKHGIDEDPDVRTSILSQYQKLPADGRPALADQLAAWKGAPDQAPVLVRPFLGAPAVAAPAAGAPAKPAAPIGRPAPDVNAGAQPRTDAGGAFQAGSASRAVGDGTYKSSREALYAAAGLPKPPPLPGGG